jgi:hypothetical protein
MFFLGFSSRKVGGFSGRLPQIDPDSGPFGHPHVGAHIEPNTWVDRLPGRPPQSPLAAKLCTCRVCFFWRDSASFHKYRALNAITLGGLRNYERTVRQQLILRRTFFVTGRRTEHG